MIPTNTPLYATPCIGATITHVQVFPTHIRYERMFGQDIFVAVDTVASVEKRGHKYGFVILSTTSRRRIICMVGKNHVNALYRAICAARRLSVIRSGQHALELPADQTLAG